MNKIPGKMAIKYWLSFRRPQSQSTCLPADRPNFKQYPNSDSEWAKWVCFGNWLLGDWKLFGIWNLDIGIFPPRWDLCQPCQVSYLN